MYHESNRDVAQGEAQLLLEDLPRNDVAVVLHLGDEHFVAQTQIGASPGVRDQVDTPRRAGSEDDLFVAGRVDETGHTQPGIFVALSCLFAQRVDATVDVGVVSTIVVIHGADDRFWLLAAGAIVQIDQGFLADPALQDREVLSDLIDPFDEGRRVYGCYHGLSRFSQQTGFFKNPVCDRRRRRSRLIILAKIASG